jgi:uncharacterized protein (TIGR00269 family)
MKNVLLSRSSLELEADALVTGHTLDDEAEVAMQSYLQGDVDRIFAHHQCSSEGIAPLIKPLRRVPEREAALYAIIHDLSPALSSQCPYQGDPMRQEIRRHLNDFEGRHPGTKYSLLRSAERLIQLKP